MKPIHAAALVLTATSSTAAQAAEADAQTPYAAVGIRFQAASRLPAE